jgi:hypothetical protein
MAIDRPGSYTSRREEGRAHHALSGAGLDGVCARAGRGFGASRSASGDPAPAERRENPSRFRDPQDGRIDLSDFLASSRGFLPTPILRGMDVACSEETTALYLQVGNAWFRP